MKSACVMCDVTLHRACLVELKKEFDTLTKKKKKEFDGDEMNETKGHSPPPRQIPAPAGLFIGQCGGGGCGDDDDDYYYYNYYYYYY